METEFIGNYKDINGDIVRVTFENRRYFYEVVDGIPDRWISENGPDRYSTLEFLSMNNKEVRAK